MRSTFPRLALAGALVAAAAGTAVAQHQGHDMQQQSGAAHAGHDMPADMHAHHAALAAAIGAKNRTPANVARDPYRHPMETLAFFGVKPGNTVVELAPGGGWYTEILAPYLAGGSGTLYAVPPAGNYAERYATKLASDPVYSGVKTAVHTPGTAIGVPDGSADVVLTFRNVHNWLGGEKPIADEVFREAYRMLKPGGTLGVVEHRLPANADAAREKTSGYVKVATVRKLAEDAGFRFAGASEVNANPKDTADWKDGVWTLPPNLRLKDQDREKYMAIGESDRMTLKFTKPAA
jgi:predicted methyltransferase